LRQYRFERNRRIACRLIFYEIKESHTIVVA
jgi:hypothetical protein